MLNLLTKIKNFIFITIIAIITICLLQNEFEYTLFSFFLLIFILITNFEIDYKKVRNVINLLLVFIIFYLAYNTTSDVIRSDFLAIYNNAKELAVHRKIIPNNALYFAVFPYQLPTLILASSFFKVLNFFKFENYFLFNSLFIFISIYYNQKIIKELVKEKEKTYILIISSFFPSILMHSVILYTNSLCLPFMSIFIYNFIQYFKYQKNKNLIIFSFILGVSILLKPNNSIFLIALFIALLLAKSKNWKLYLFPICSIIILNLSFGHYINGLNLFDNIPYKELGVDQIGPFGDIGQHKETNGGWYRGSHKYTFEKKGSKSSIKETLSKEYKEYIKKNSREDFYNKLKINLKEPEFFLKKIRNKTYINPDFGMRFWIKYNSQSYKTYYVDKFISLFGTLNILLIFLGSFTLIQSKRTDILKNTMTISIIGIFIYLLIFEAQPRYLVTYLPIFLTCSFLGADTGILKLRLFIQNLKEKISF